MAIRVRSPWKASTIRSPIRRMWSLRTRAGCRRDGWARLRRTDVLDSAWPARLSAARPRGPPSDTRPACAGRLRRADDRRSLASSRDEVEDALAVAARRSRAAAASLRLALENSRSNTSRGFDFLGLRRGRHSATRGLPSRHSYSPNRSCPLRRPCSQPISSDGNRVRSPIFWAATLVDRDADLDVGPGGLARLPAGQEDRHRPGVVAGAVAVGPGLVQGQAAQDREVVRGSPSAAPAGAAAR